MPGRTPVLSEAQFSTAHEAGGVRELTGRAPVWPRSPHSLFPPLPTVQLSPARPHGGLAAAADPGGYAPLPRGSEGGTGAALPGNPAGCAPRDLGTRWGRSAAIASCSPEPAGGREPAPLLGHKESNGEGESRPPRWGCDPRPTPALTCARTIFPCHLVEEQDSLSP